MKIALHDADKKAPNLALMKLSRFYRESGCEVEMWHSEVRYDATFSSQVFTYTKCGDDLQGVVIKGGSSNSLELDLVEAVEHTCPDYGLYGIDYSMGFLTRGCNRNCLWCIVPQKEGKIRPHADVEEFLRHDHVAFLDNNVLQSDHGIEQIEKLGRLGVKVDFNQGLDARLIDDGIARRLSKVKWWKPLRLACDTRAQMPIVQKAVELLRWHNTTPTKYFCYVLVQNVEEAAERVKFLKGIHLDPFAQPYRDLEGTPPTEEQRHFARWVNHKAEFRSQTWEEYRTRKMGGGSE